MVICESLPLKFREIFPLQNLLHSKISPLKVIMTISYFVTHASMGAHVSNRSKFDTFFIFILCYDNTIKKHKITLYSSGCLQMFYKIVGVLKSQRCYLKLCKFHLKKTCAGYRVNVKFRLYAFCLHLNSKDAPTHSCFSVSSAEVFRWPFFLNTVGWVLLTLYTIYLNQTNAWQLVFYLLFLQTLQKFLGTNWKKYDSRRDLLHVSKCLASRKCHLTTKNKFTPDIYNLWYCGAPKTFKRFPRKLSW